MNRYEKFFDIKNPRILDLVYENIEDKTDEMTETYEKAKENCKKEDYKYKISQIISIIFTILLTLLFVVGLSLIISTAIHYYFDVENEFFLAAGEFFVSDGFKEFGDLEYFRMIIGMTATISIGILLFILFITLRKPKEKKNSEEKEMKIENAFKSLDSSQNDEWKDIQNQFIKKCLLIRTDIIIRDISHHI